MNRDKQIDVMRFDIADIDGTNGIRIIGYVPLATALCELGYRKASEVAREVIEDIATLIETHWSDIKYIWLINGRANDMRKLLKTVEKKYTEGEG